MAGNLNNEVFTVMPISHISTKRANTFHLKPLNTTTSNRQLCMSLEINGRENRRGNQE